MNKLRELADQWESFYPDKKADANLPWYEMGKAHTFDKCASQLRAELAKMPTLDAIVKELRDEAQGYMHEDIREIYGEIADRIEQAIAATQPPTEETNAQADGSETDPV